MLEPTNYETDFRLGAVFMTMDLTPNVSLF